MQTLICGCSQLVTLAGPARPRSGPEMSDLGLVPKGLLLVEDGHVIAVGSTDEVRRAVEEGCIEVDVGGRIVSPGLVDAHTHPVFQSPRLNDFEQRAQGRSYAEIAQVGGGIRSTVLRNRALDENGLSRAASRNIRRMLAAGTTALEAKSGYGGSVEAELAELRALASIARKEPATIVPTLLGAHAVPEGFTPSSFAAVVAEEMIPVAAREGLAKFVDVFVEDGYYSPDDARLIACVANRHGLGLRLHVDQLREGGGAALAAELGARSADHLEHVSDEGIQALKAAGVMPVLLPGSVYFLGSSRYAPARKMIDCGLPVVLATDFNPGSSPVFSLTSVMNLACTQMRMSPAEALVSCTINAAYAIDLGEQIGSLEKGKRADFVVWDAEDFRELAYWVGADLVHEVWVSGGRLDPL